MSRVVVNRALSPVHPVLLALVLLLATLVGSGPAWAQGRPVCDDVGAADGCRLPEWTEETRGPASLFGAIDSGIWVADDVGDAPPGGLDIVGVGIAPVRVREAARIRQSGDLLRVGPARRAVRGGRGILVRVVLDSPLDAIADGHTSVHLATDIDGRDTNNAPAGVSRPDGPFAGSQDVYSLTYATTTGKARLLDSDLAKRWYRDKGPIAASLAAPDVIDFLVRPATIGDGIRVATFVSGEGGGYDSLTLGPNAIPLDGLVGQLPLCSEAYVSSEPFVVGRLIENGQPLRDVETPGSWQGGAAVPIDAASRASLVAFIERNDSDGDGIVSLPSTVSVVEEGLVIRQRPEVQLSVVDDAVQVALQLGLTRRGYHVLRSIALAETDDAAVDATLERVVGAIVDATPPFRTNRRSGLLYGSGVGSCADRLIAPLPVAADDAVADEDAATAEQG